MKIVLMHSPLNSLLKKQNKKKKVLSCAQFKCTVLNHALVQVLEVDDEAPGLDMASSCHLSRLRLRAFIKKLLTVLNSRPSCCEIVICISLDGRLFSLKMAKRVRRWRSVKTSRGFFGVLLFSLFCSCSLRLHAAKGRDNKTNVKEDYLNHHESSFKRANFVMSWLLGNQPEPYSDRGSPVLNKTQG